MVLLSLIVFPNLIQLRSQSQEMVLPTIGECSYLKVIKTIPHRHAQGQPDLDSLSLGLYSQVIIDYVKLEIKTSH